MAWPPLVCLCVFMCVLVDVEMINKLVESEEEKVDFLVIKHLHLFDFLTLQERNHIERNRIEKKNNKHNLSTFL